MCEYNNTETVGDFRDIANVGYCQMICLHSHSCYYFLYDKETKGCTLLNSREMFCNVFTGSPRPDGKTGCEVPTCKNNSTEPLCPPHKKGSDAGNGSNRQATSGFSMMATTVILLMLNVMCTNLLSE